MAVLTGSHIGRFEKTGLRDRVVGIFSGIIALASLAVVITTIRSSHGITANSELLAAGIVLLASAVISFWTLNAGFIEGSATLDLFMDGFSITDKAGQVTHNWTEVQTYTHNVVRTQYRRYGIKLFTTTTYKLSLETLDGQHYVFKNGVRDMPRLAQILPDLTVTPLVTQLVAKLNAGETIKLGRWITVGPDGLTRWAIYGTKRLAWSEVAGATTNSGNIIIYKRMPNGKGPKTHITAPIRWVPNGLALVHLVSESAKKVG